MSGGGRECINNCIYTIDMIILSIVKIAISEYGKMRRLNKAGVQVQDDCRLLKRVVKIVKLLERSLKIVG